MATERSEGFSCDRCGTCCRTHRVPLTQADVIRLENAGEHAPDFVEFLASEAVDLDGEPESFALLDEGRRAAFLKHVAESRSDLGGMRCVFLTSSGCRVHVARPSACRTYPFDRPSDDSSLGLAPFHRCPTETGVLSTLRLKRDDPSVQEILSDISARDRESSEHATLLLRFNQRQRTRLKLGHRLASAGGLRDVLSTRKPEVD